MEADLEVKNWRWENWAEKNNLFKTYRWKKNVNPRSRKMKEEEEIRTIREEIVCLVMIMNLSLLSLCLLTFVYEIFILCSVVLFLVRCESLLIMRLKTFLYYWLPVNKQHLIRVSFCKWVKEDFSKVTLVLGGTSFIVSFDHSNLFFLPKHTSNEWGIKHGGNWQKYTLIEANQICFVWNFELCEY